MADNSNIQWTDATWNPWYGCIKVADGCKNCYMYRDFDRWNKDPRQVTRSKTRFNDPLKWKEPRLIFTCSLSDFFIDEADAWRDEAWRIIKETPQHFYQILTKRVVGLDDKLPVEEFYRVPYLPNNCIIMLSVSTQKDFDSCWPVLENMARTWFFKIGLSIEPILEPIDLSGWLECGNFKDDFIRIPQWVIVGGESGHKTGKYKARFTSKDWIEGIVTQCKQAEIPVFVKQLGSDFARRHGLKHPHGGDFDEFPEHLKVREYPDIFDRRIKIQSCG